MWVVPGRDMLPHVCGAGARRVAGAIRVATRLWCRCETCCHTWVVPVRDMLPHGGGAGARHVTSAVVEEVNHHHAVIDHLSCFCCKIEISQISKHNKNKKGAFGNILNESWQPPPGCISRVNAHVATHVGNLRLAVYRVLMLMWRLVRVTFTKKVKI